MDRLLQPVQFIKGVGPKRSKQLNRLGIKTVFDLLWHTPRTYFNRGKIEKTSSLQEGQAASIRGKVVATRMNRTRRGMYLFKAMIKDSSGTVWATWFNQPYMDNIVTTGKEIFLTGKVKTSYGSSEINVTQYEIIEAEDSGQLVVPVYALTEGLNQKVMRSIIRNALDNYLDDYPEILCPGEQETYNLCDIQTAFNNIHFPQEGKIFLKARRRLAFEELLLFQASLRQEQTLTAVDGYVVHKEKTDLVEKVLKDLPFVLTPAQQKVTDEIFKDMESPVKMNRLLQGDVGSGKTVVAALALSKSVASGFQAALMAPTEILAEQHFTSISRLLPVDKVVLACLTGSTSAPVRQMIIEATARGEIDILVGTHSLIQEEVVFQNLGLVIIDEQHRFGVKQRALLGQKGNAPDNLVMTATPIPRTLALTLYGNLDLSIIDELPPGRKPVKTMYVKPAFRSRVYNFIRQEISKNKSQAYVICPLVEESEHQDLQAAVSLYQELRTQVFPDLSVGLLHGRLKTAEKDYIMDKFRKGLVSILVATTVVEVGVDVANASIMVIEQAERFGLSQLHQLRGRVGRSDLQSFCILIGEPKTEEGFRRLKAMEKTNDGFKLAQEDLIIRGPGEFWGVRQHGLNQLKVADLIRDHKLIETSRQLIRSWPVRKMDEYVNYINLKFGKNNDIASN